MAMKLILLPGMDGTGLLFKDLLEHLTSLECEVIALPETGSQDVETLADYVAARLPEHEYVVLAESFSGKVAERLLLRQDRNLKAVIFVASFLSRPGFLLPRLAAALPVRTLIEMPASSLAIRSFLIGREASDETIARLKGAVRSVPQKVLRARLRQIAGMRYEKHEFKVPALYIRPRNDVLVRNRVTEFKRSFPNITVVEMDGPHFILQAKPEECAGQIVGVVKEWAKEGALA